MKTYKQFILNEDVRFDLPSNEARVLRIGENGAPISYGMASWGEGDIQSNISHSSFGLMEGAGWNRGFAKRIEGDDKVHWLSIGFNK